MAGGVVARMSEDESPVGEIDFDHHDPAFVADPHPRLAEIRESHPLIHSEHYGGFWLLSRYEDVTAAAIDWQRFTSSVVGTTVIPPSQPRDYPQLPIELDPPKHTLYRNIVNPIFAKSRVEVLRPELHELATDLLGSIVERGRGDFVSEFATPMSLGTLGMFMGLPLEDQRKWGDWVRRMFEGSINDPEEQKRAGAEFQDYLDGLVAERKQERRDDFISLLLDTEVDGHRLTDLEIRGFGVVMLMAGHETTAGAMSMTTQFLAEEPEIRERVFAEPDLIPTAVNEFLRLFPSIQVFCRNAAEDLELHGAEIKLGEVVALAYAAANRDPRQFPEPDACVLDRQPNRHVTFGYGRHLCLGANVARLEMAVMLAELAERMPDFALDPDQAPVWRARGDVRGLLSLPLVLNY